MSRLSWLVLLLLVSLFQLVWLFRVWRRDGFGAAIKLFFYGVLSAFGVFMQYELGL